MRPFLTDYPSNLKLKLGRFEFDALDELVAHGIVHNGIEP